MPRRGRDKAKPLADRIERASWLAARARVDLDLFTVLTPIDNVDLLDEQAILFEVVRTAHEHAFLVRIANLFAPRTDTDNFPELVEEGERTGEIDAATIAAVRARLEATDGAYRRVEILRNKVVAHQDDTYSKAEIYERVEPTLAMFTNLSNESFAIAAALCSAVGVRPQAASRQPVEQLERIVLAEVPGWRLRPRPT